MIKKGVVKSPELIHRDPMTMATADSPAPAAISIPVLGILVDGISDVRTTKPR